ncbi:MAG: C1 family peptidase [Chitinophagaceae bacterium]
MPVRMTDDPQDQGDFNDDNSGGGNSGGGGRMPGGGGGGGLFALLPLLMGLFRSKFGIVVLILGAGAYFLFGQKSCSGLRNTVSQFATGGNLDPKEYKKAMVYEGLADDNVKNPLPEMVSLARFAPQRQNQGHQGSCVAWSSAYGARTILEAASKGINPDATAFSPSFLYNQIGLDGCEGSYIIRAMEFMQGSGALPLSEFPYDETNCSRTPNSNQMQEAANYKIRSFSRLSSSEDVNGINVRAIKEHLAKDAPVVIGMLVGGSFMQDMMGQKVWHPTSEDQQQMGFGGHAMCVIGYDDRMEGGAVQIMNSWGPEWGENGIGWIRYADFKNFLREAYGIDPLPKQGAALNQPFDCEVGLVEVAGGKPKGYIGLSGGSNNVFTSATVAKGITFKVEVKNTNECYVYVFGQETDNSSYTLFPYPKQDEPTKTAFSPYCGITGYRLFPRGKSMQPDSVGTKDYIAVVVSKQELNWFNLNETISKNRTNYANAVSTALNSIGATTSNMRVNATGKGNMHFSAPAGDKSVAYAIVEINKQ